MPALTPSERQRLAWLYCANAGIDPDSVYQPGRRLLIEDGKMVKESDTLAWEAYASAMADFYTMYRACKMFDAGEEP